MNPQLDARARVQRSPLPYVLSDVDVRAESSRAQQRRAGLMPRAPNPSAAEFFVPGLPGVPDLASHPTHPVNLYAGELASYPGEGKGGGEGAVGKDAQIFFMMARARRSAGKQRVIFWFNGGPGCSSFDGSLMEVGPFRTVPAKETESGQAEIRLVEGGWEEFATIVFIDQPPGTGLSYVPTEGYVHELDEASQHLIHFMTNFYKVFPELDGVDTYLAGESYAGQYIPYFATNLLKTDQLPKLQFKGIAIGNGWIDPLRQYPAYAEFAYNKGLIKKGTDAAKELEAVLEACNVEIAKYTDPLNTPININVCEGVMSRVTDPFTETLNGKKQCMNIYDIRLMDDFPACGMGWPPDLPDVYDFLGRKDVVHALHADVHVPAWVECDGRVGSSLSNRKSPAAVHLIPGIVEAGVKVLMFAGAEDLICNHVGIENMLDVMEWNGETGFGNATAQNWYVNGTQVGTWTTGRNMSYALVYDSSHMVGFDVPHVTNDMIMRFMDVDISLMPGLTGATTSKIGDDERPAVHFGEPPDDGGMPLLKGGTGDWESWYNAISAVLILLTLIGIVGLYLYFRRRRLAMGGGRLALGSSRRSPRGLGHGHSRSVDDDREERVPLAGADEYELDDTLNGHSGSGSLDSNGKGKGKARDSMEDMERGETVFALGEEDDHEK